MNLGYVEHSVDAYRSEAGGFEEQCKSQGLPSGSHTVALVSHESEVLTKLLTELEKVRRSAEEAQTELLEFRTRAAEEINSLNKRMVEEKSRFEWLTISYRRQIADLTAESHQMYLDASNDRVNPERSW